jgi:hypothetical protein
MKSRDPSAQGHVFRIRCLACNRSLALLGSARLLSGRVSEAAQPRTVSVDISFFFLIIVAVRIFCCPVLGTISAVHLTGLLLRILKGFKVEARS